MNWFKNLNATPKLMIGFGILSAWLLGISALAIMNLGNANERMTVLYEKDMSGQMHAGNMAIARAMNGRAVRDAILNADDPASVDADNKTVQSNFANFHSDLDAAQKLFYSSEGIAALTTIRNVLPAYEQSYRDLFARLNAKDVAGARAALVATDTIGAPLFEAIDRAREIKNKAGQDKNEANLREYQTARAVLLAACIVGLVLGVILSIVIARGFSIPLNRAVKTLQQIEDGDLTVSLDVYTKDEVGTMSMALNAALEKLRSALQNVADSAQNATLSSRELAEATGAIATGAQQQAASLEETSASLEQITATVRQSADNAQQAS
jgi:methyl-accepting chemotaxis protein